MSNFERIVKRLRRDRPMVSITLRMPEDVLEDLKRIAPVLGHSGYQPLIRAYVGRGLRVDLERVDGSELEALIAGGPGEIAKLERSLADPGLYGRNPATFDRLTKSLAAKQAEVASAEEEWLALEDRREALAAGRQA